MLHWRVESANFNKASTLAERCKSVCVMSHSGTTQSGCGGSTSTRSERFYCIAQGKTQYPFPPKETDT